MVTNADEPEGSLQHSSGRARKRLGTCADICHLKVVEAVVAVDALTYRSGNTPLVSQTEAQERQHRHGQICLEGHSLCRSYFTPCTPGHMRRTLPWDPPSMRVLKKPGPPGRQGAADRAQSDRATHVISVRRQRRRAKSIAKSVIRDV